MSKQKKQLIRWFSVPVFAVLCCGFPNILRAQPLPWRVLLNEFTGHLKNNYIGVAHSDSNNCTVVGFSSGSDSIGGKGYRLVMQRTKDGGKSWVSQPTPIATQISIYEAKLTKLSAPDSLHVYAVGDSGFIVATSDAGEHWVQQNQKHIWTYWDVSFCDSTHGIAIGNYGKIAMTSDGGNNWIFHDSVYRYALESAVAISPSCYYVFDSFFGKMLRTFDAGKTWDTITMFTDTYDGTTGKQILETRFLSPLIGFAVGGSAHSGLHPLILRTSDGGVKWISVYDSSAFQSPNLTAIDACDANHLVATTNYYGVLRSSDAGLTWVQDTISTSVSAFLAVDVAYLSADKILVIESEGPTSHGVSGKVVGQVPFLGVASNPKGVAAASTFPNPFSQHFTLQLPNSAAAFDIELRDLLGRKVFGFKGYRGNSISIDRAGLPEGIYEAVIFAKGELIAHSKVVAQ